MFVNKDFKKSLERSWCETEEDGIEELTGLYADVDQSLNDRGAPPMKLHEALERVAERREMEIALADARVEKMEMFQEWKRQAKFMLQEDKAYLQIVSAEAQAFASLSTKAAKAANVIVAAAEAARRREVARRAEGLRKTNERVQRILTRGVRKYRF